MKVKDAQIKAKYAIYLPPRNLLIGLYNMLLKITIFDINFKITAQFEEIIQKVLYSKRTNHISQSQINLDRMLTLHIQ